MLAESHSSEFPLDPLIGTVLDGRYRVLRVIGEGGMGLVYAGEHTLIERPVAIKVLRDDFCKRPDAVERFRREAKSASRIGHPNIVDVLDFGETPGGASYFVMEMLKGKDLADTLAQGGALSPERAVLIAYQCCHALAAAHDKGIVHRDLKPENIFLIEREGFADFVKIVDFGVAKMTDLEVEAANANGGAAAGTHGSLARARLTRTGMIFGTPEYMSPEQAAGVPPDHRVDIYALGITLYELLTGRVPFEGDSFMNVLSKHANKQVPALRDVNPRLNVSAALENLIRHALRKDRNQRLQHMRDMALALEAVPEMPPVPFRLSRPSLTPVRGSAPSDPQLAAPVKSATTDYDTGMPNWRRRGLFAALSAAGLALGAGVAFYGETPSSARTASHETAPALPPVTAAAPGEEAHGAPPRPADEGAALDLVTVRVTTEPAGASVKLAGGEQVCAATPCAFDVVRGAPVSLLAQRGAQQATTNLTPQAATDLHLVLALTKPPKKPASPPRVPHDDLKVPALFQAHAK